MGCSSALAGFFRRAAFATTWASAALAVATVAVAQVTTTQPAVIQSAVTQPVVRPASIVAEPYVLIVSLDGCRPDCLLRADAPNVRGLMARGSFTLWAHTTPIAITTPSHVSMLSGVPPERHGITFNDDPPPDLLIAVPTIFDLAKAAGLSTGMASGKRKFTLFTRTNHVDFLSLTDLPVSDDASVAQGAAAIIAAHRPRLMFVHFPGADTVGHAVGWGTPEQVAKLGEIDVQVGRVLKAYDDAGLRDRLYVILTADHGGTARVHGKDDERSRFIPWVAAGPGVRANFDLTRLGHDYDVNTYDTFATACLILDLPIPAGVDGKPVMPIFADVELLVGPAVKPLATGPATRPTH